MLETTEQRTHPLRLELDNFFFVQAIAGPERSRIVGFFLHGMSWLTLVVMPVILLLYMQLVLPALPRRRHHLGASRRPDGRHRAPGLHRRVPLARWRRRSSGRSGARACIIPSACCSPPCCWPWWPASRSPSPPSPARPSTRRPSRQANARECRLCPGLRRAGPRRQRRRARCFGLFHRNLIVTDTDLVVDKDVTPGEPSINLRGRDLRFAKLDRTDLHQADMTGANLEGASLVGADLRGVWLSCARSQRAAPDQQPRRCPVRQRARRQLRQGSPRPRPRWPASTCAAASSRRRSSTAPQLAHALMTGASFANARLDRRRPHGAPGCRGQLPAGLAAGRRPLGRQAA